MEEAIRNHLLQSIDVKVKAAETCAEVTAKAVQLMVQTLKSGGTIYLCGNGGSAADCQHVAGELVGRFKLSRPGLRAMALTTDTSIITSIANDFDYEEVFARQASAFIRKGDCLIAISTSGNAVNVNKAAAVARQRGAAIIALTGESGGQLKQLADCLIAAPSAETPHVQELHITLLHVMCDLVEKEIAGA